MVRCCLDIQACERRASICGCRLLTRRACADAGFASQHVWSYAPFDNAARYLDNASELRPRTATVLQQAIQDALKKEVDEDQFQAKAQELSGGRRGAPTRVARGALADRVNLQDLVEWVRKDRSGSFNIILATGEPSRLLYEIIRKENWSLFILGKLAGEEGSIQVYPDRPNPAQRKREGKGQRQRQGQTKRKRRRQAWWRSLRRALRTCAIFSLGLFLNIHQTRLPRVIRTSTLAKTSPPLVLGSSYLIVLHQLPTLGHSWSLWVCPGILFMSVCYAQHSRVGPSGSFLGYGSLITK